MSIELLVTGVGQGHYIWSKNGSYILHNHNLRSPPRSFLGILLEKLKFVAVGSQWHFWNKTLI